MSISAKSFHLRWNNHLQNLRTLFESIYNEQNLVDVTLSCTDGLLRAHKLVLSACSPYFETVFRDNPCKHPVVILKGISLQEMQTLLEYMYIGSVDVMEDDLETLLSVANELQIKGLVQKQSFHNGSPNPTQENKKFDNEKKLRDMQMKQDKQYRIETFLSPEADGNFYNKRKFKINKPVENFQQKIPHEEFNAHNDCEGSSSQDNENAVFAQMQPVIKMESYEENGEAGNNMDTSNVVMDEAPPEKPLNTQEMIDEHDDDATFCLICNKNFHSKQNLRRHLQTHTGEKPHRCEYCELSFLRLSHLQRHIRVHTGERPYACSLCPKQFSRSDKLKQHVALHHGSSYEPNKDAKKPRGRPRLHSTIGNAPSAATANPSLGGLNLPMHFSDITVSPVSSS